MTLVIDSSAWIEWLTKSDLGVELNPQIPDITDCFIPTIV